MGIEVGDGAKHRDTDWNMLKKKEAALLRPSRERNGYGTRATSWVVDTALQAVEDNSSERHTSSGLGEVISASRRQGIFI